MSSFLAAFFGALLGTLSAMLLVGWLAGRRPKETEAEKTLKKSIVDALLRKQGGGGR